jgi:tetratricopeptide (TPR) repeat protein
MLGLYQAGYFNNLGVAYMALAKAVVEPKRAEAWRNAKVAFRKSLEGQPTNVRTIDSLVNVSYRLGEGTMLEQELRKKVEGNQNDFQTLYSLAALLSLEERYGDSLDYFQRAEKAFYYRDPGGETLFFNHAFALSKAGQVDNAIAKYLEALRVDPFFSEAHFNLALLYVGKQDHNSALQHLTNIMSREPNNVRANMMLAEIYAYQGNLPSARHHLQQVLQAEPQNTQALNLQQRIGMP